MSRRLQLPRNVDDAMNPLDAENRIRFHQSTDEELIIQFNGCWTLSHGLPALDPVRDRIGRDDRIRRVGFDTHGLEAWDSLFPAFLKKMMPLFEARQIQLDSDGLPPGVRQLLSLAAAVPEKKGTSSQASRPSFLSRIGEMAVTQWQSVLAMLGFVGEAFLAFLRLLGGRAGFRRVDLIQLIQDTGVEALPIVSLISILVGVILAFVGVIQLKLFGAQIYVADLVGIGMAREMGAMMTAIIMAGRTGAAFAAQLGTMMVNEEIDALSTMGISPMDFLVLPRMLALILMMPLLCLYADLMGILGGAIVGSGMFDIPLQQYYEQTRGAVSPTDFCIGVAKSGVFGVLVAIAGCYHGMQCGRSASAVGLVATAAVVTAIVFIVVSDALMTVMCSVLGI